MVTVFNRRELLVLQFRQKLFEVRQALDAAGIEHASKAHGQFDFAQGRYRGTPGIRQEYAVTYSVYVRKQDYDRARQAIEGVLRQW